MENVSSSSGSKPIEDGWLYIAIGAFLVIYFSLGCILLCYIYDCVNGPPENDEEDSEDTCCFPANVSPFRRSRPFR